MQTIGLKIPVVIGTPAKKVKPSLLAQYKSNCDHERLSALVRKSPGPICLCDRRRHRSVPVWYHGDLAGLTRNEHSVAWPIAIRFGKIEDLRELLLRTPLTNAKKQVPGTIQG